MFGSLKGLTKVPFGGFSSVIEGLWKEILDNGKIEAYPQEVVSGGFSKGNGHQKPPVEGVQVVTRRLVIISNS